MNKPRFCQSAAGRWVAIAVAIAAACAAGRDADAAADPEPGTGIGRSLPAPATDFHGLRVQVYGQGRPVLMVPGLASGAQTWSETCLALQPGVQCHLVQLPGFAGQPPVQVPESRWLETMRDRLLAYVAARQLARPVVVGHSLGGALALMMAAESPQAVDRLVVVDALPFLAALRQPDATAADAARQAAGLRQQMVQATPAEYDAQTRAAAPGMTRREDGVARLVAWSRDSDRATVGAAFAELWGTDLRPRLARIERPVLVLGAWAAYAPMGATLDGTRRLYEAQYAALRGVRVRMSEHGRHFLMWDDPDWLVAQVRGVLAE